MKWLKNLESMANSNRIGNCPYCNSANTDYKFVVVIPPNMGYGDIWCEDCKRAFHISRTKISNDMKQTGEIPHDLIY